MLWIVSPDDPVILAQSSPHKENAMNNLSINENYLVDKEGRQIGVLLTMQEYRILINRLKELESYKAARDEINIVDQLLSESKGEIPVENMPTFKRRQGPGGTVVV